MEPDRIGVEEAMKRRQSDQDIVFLDARNPTDWGASAKKIPGAMRARSDEEVRQALEKVPKGHTVITYCT